MGIPGLRFRLQPFAQTRQLNNTSVVIDGPGLAYHFLALHMRGDSPALYQPKCFVATLMKWLELLENHGVEIEAIYFDGYLPKEKFNTRMKREVARCQRSTVFFDSNPKGCALPMVCPQDKDVDPLAQPCPSSTTPVTPFVVAAVLDAFVDSSKYRDRTFVVPGEADIYCATYAAQRKNISVLSGDSDLVVHNLGPGGGLVYFSDISDGGNNKLQCLRYEPETIERMLNLPESSLVKLAYEVTENSHAETRALAKRIIQDPDSYNGPQFDAFAEPYGREIELPSSSGTDSVPLVYLDARSSETVFQYLELTDGSKPLHHFLPALVDSNFDFSGWIPSLPIRQIAYSVLPFLKETKIDEVREFRRTVQTTSQGTAVALISTEDFEAFVEALSQGIAQPTTKNTTDMVLMTTLILELEHASSLDRTPLSFKLLSSNLIGPDKRSTLVAWPLMHFKAQVEACVYSLRMLSQVSEFAKASKKLESLSEKCLQQISDTANLCPGLCELPGVKEIEEFFFKLQGNAEFTKLCQKYSIKPPRVKAKNMKKSISQTGKVQKQTSGSNAKRTLPKNPFGHWTE